MPAIRYLALGDSYTIGESVSESDRWPNQLAGLIEASPQFTESIGETREGIELTIIARTGWTTDELAASIREHNITETFSFVSLLIGVNNQYRGRDVENYKQEFKQLLEQAIVFAKGKPEHVFVISIPDWGVTPFAEGKDKAKVAHEIDAYNNAAKEIVLAHKCHYIEITESTRKNGTDVQYLAGDGLHPSGKEYTVWAERLKDAVMKEFAK